MDLHECDAQAPASRAEKPEQDQEFVCRDIDEPDDLHHHVLIVLHQSREDDGGNADEEVEGILVFAVHAELQVQGADFV